MSQTTADAYHKQYMQDQTLAELMIPLVGQLYRERGVIVTVFGRKLMGANTIDIIKAHRLGFKLAKHHFTLSDASLVLKVMSEMSLGASRVDIGRLHAQFCAQSEKTLDEFIHQALAKINHVNTSVIDEPRDVVLYGFGRIGRVLARLLIERTGVTNKLRLRAIVVRPSRQDTQHDLEKRASLLRRDSIHGPFNGTITVDVENQAIVANGNYIQVIYAASPADIDYTEYGINNALVVDNTGVWKDAEGLGQHLKSTGASKVLLTAPASGEIKNIVYGVNHEMITDQDHILCAASCTTNAITPVLKVIDERFGIDNGHVETVHSYTNDQNLIDNYHKGERRGRSAALNMVLTSTGAAKAVAKALPQLAGKLTGNAIRVPTPNVSMAVINLNLRQSVSVDEINEHLRAVAFESNLGEQIGFTTSTEVVSSDMIGSPEAGIVDGQATIADGQRCVLYVWYDNEFGYSNQVLRVMRQVAGMRLPRFPE